MTNPVKKGWEWFVDLVEGEDGPDEILYDPVHVAAVIVGSLCAMGLVFWLLWALLVCEGGMLGVRLLFMERQTGQLSKTHFTA